MARLCRPVPAFLAALMLALMSGGCSLSYQLDSLLGKNEDKNEYTGSIAPAGNRVTDAAPASVEGPMESDLTYARAVVSEVLSRGSKDASAPWTNPQTGARGTVTPLATAYDQDGFVCRDFLASYVRQDAEAWLQGEACNMQGQWQVRSMRPWKRS
jgi:outer membrane surface antigen